MLVIATLLFDLTIYPLHIIHLMLLYPLLIMRQRDVEVFVFIEILQILFTHLKSTVIALSRLIFIRIFLRRDQLLRTLAYVKIC